MGLPMTTSLTFRIALRKALRLTGLTFLCIYRERGLTLVPDY